MSPLFRVRCCLRFATLTRSLRGHGRDKSTACGAGSGTSRPLARPLSCWLSRDSGGEPPCEVVKIRLLPWHSLRGCLRPVPSTLRGGEGVHPCDRPNRRPPAVKLISFSLILSVGANTVNIGILHEIPCIY